MFTSNRKKILPIFVSLLVIALNVSLVFAEAPQAVHIEVLEFINTSGESFAASGAAVASGALCASGTVDDLSVEVAGSPAGDLRILNVHKRFYCGDASGTFDVMMVVQLDLVTSETTARWRISSGTGDYADPKGNGSLVGIPVAPGASILDIYDGIVL